MYIASVYLVCPSLFFIVNTLFITSKRDRQHAYRRQAAHIKRLNGISMLIIRISSLCNFTRPNE
ncbi:hypothetical protein HMPREF0663_10119 [Hoylesella oralis ATCC 33269]|uniref:Uncharacterized protein n=1 Tax=Hoylesella oralis ATCC 33269 TaxID=873533 RepID=E7RLW9_9BACT|nr:hypothetical protein HMPREF0663_10119 [Hoylesella oralis ATCC 33269]